MTVYEGAWLEEVKRGTRVRATSTRTDIPPVTLEFTVSEVDEDNELMFVVPSEPGYTGLSDVDPSARTHVYPTADWDVEILPAPLPTADGIYLDTEGDYWIIDSKLYRDSSLRIFSRGEGVYHDLDSYPNGTPEAHAPFTRLTPEGE